MKKWIAFSLLTLPAAASAELPMTALVSGSTWAIHIAGAMSTGADAQQLTAGAFTLLRAVGFIAVGQTLDAPNGLRISPGLFGGAPTMISHRSAYSLTFGEPGAQSTLFIPANGMDKDYIVRTSSAPVMDPERVSPLVIQAANTSLAGAGDYTYPLSDRIWEVSFFQADGTTRAPREAIRGRITLPYEDADDDGIVDNTQPPVRVSTLSIWWLDEEHGLWVRLPESVVDTANHTVSAPVRYASVFAVMGSPSVAVAQVRAFPSPWRPNGPDAGAGPGGTGTSAGITFTNLPDQGTIRIFTLAGALVREISHNVGPQETWDGKNDAGEDVATGVYIFTVESSAGKKSGKLAVIR